MRTLQEMFNLAYKGLESQNWQKSLGPTNRCLYLTAVGLKCAIGHTIPGIETYTRERWFVRDVSIIPPKILDTEATALELVWLQRAHDWSKSPEDCKARLEAFAEEYQLSIPN
jgi:hypothetical protein